MAELKQQMDCHCSLWKFEYVEVAFWVGPYIYQSVKYTFFNGNSLISNLGSMQWHRKSDG